MLATVVSVGGAREVVCSLFDVHAYVYGPKKLALRFQRVRAAAVLEKDGEVKVGESMYVIL